MVIRQLFCHRIVIGPFRLKRKWNLRYFENTNINIKSNKKYKGQECIPVGCVPAARRPYAGVCFPGGCLVRGGLLPEGVSGPGGVVSQHALRQKPPPPLVNRMTNRCKNITLATASLRPVIILEQLYHNLLMTPNSS